MTKNVLQRKSKKYIWMVCVWKQKKIYNFVNVARGSRFRAILTPMICVHFKILDLCHSTNLEIQMKYRQDIDLNSVPF